MTIIKSRLSVATIFAMRSSVASAIRTEGGLVGFTQNRSFTAGSRSLSISVSGNCQVCSPLSVLADASMCTLSKAKSGRPAISR
jgi:hypothetical protein